MYPEAEPAGYTEVVATGSQSSRAGAGLPADLSDLISQPARGASQPDKWWQ